MNHCANCGDPIEWAFDRNLRLRRLLRVRWHSRSKTIRCVVAIDKDGNAVELAPDSAILCTVPGCKSVPEVEAERQIQQSGS